MTDTTLPPPTNDGRTPGDPPLMPFWLMDNTAEGHSKIVQRLLEGFHQKSVSGRSDMDARVFRHG
jgi:hypothetical protein